MVLKKGLKTLGKLKIWGVVESDLSVQCWNKAETEEHLLFECRLVKEVWKKLKMLMGYSGVVVMGMEDELN